MKKTTIFVVIALLSLFAVTVVSAEETTVEVDPLSKTVFTGDTFSVDIICNPTQPVKAFEFGLTFNPSLLQANYVIKGDFFDGYSSFFNDGTIDNSAGKIYDVFDLIIGQGNVSESGSLVSISFTAKQNSGTTTLNLNGVGVTDELGYIEINVSDGSVTVQSTGGGGGPGGGGYPPPPPPPNNPPETPDVPVGPTFVELGVEYQFSAVTVDEDNDLIKYMFDWGDGSYSSWSPYAASNVSVNVSKSWDSVSTFEIRVIAMDDNGDNSSWSLPLNITVSQADIDGEPPVAQISIPENLTVNKVIAFDASGSFDEDGFIVSYYWDFGDGEKGNGINPTHVYKIPGEYNVSLSVTDNNGNTFNTSIIISVASELTEQGNDEQALFPLYLGFVFIALVIAIFASVGLFYRGNLKSFLSSHQLGSSLHSGRHIQHKLNKIEAKIEKLKR